MFKIKRMEQALALAEDSAADFFCWWTMMFAEKTADKGPFGLAVNYRDFRKYLLHIRESGIAAEDFTVPEEYLLPDIADSFYGAITGIHIDLAHWMAKSRRVYSLSQSQAMKLAMTSVESLTWRDIQLPFGSFAISLEKPIITSIGKSFDLILVAKMTIGGKDFMSIDLFSPDLANFRPRRSDERKMILRRMKRGEYSQMVKLLNRRFKSAKPYNSRVILSMELIADQPILSSMAELGNKSNAELLERRNFERPVAQAEDFPEWDEAANLICGLCLCLSSLHYPQRPASSSYRRNAESMPDSSAIRAEDHIFNIAKIVTLDTSRGLGDEEIIKVSDSISSTDDESEAMKKTGGSIREMCAHFRRGHWRFIEAENGERRPVWIRPALVRADRLPLDRLPGGVIQKLK